MGIAHNEPYFFKHIIHRKKKKALLYLINGRERKGSMDIQCRQISPYAKKCLQDPGYFQLLSKFEYVLNLWDGKNVLSLQTAQLQLTPLSLVLQEEDFRAVSSVLNRDRGCSAGGGLLRGDDWTIDTGTVKTFTCRFPEQKGNYPKESMLCIARAAWVLAKPDSLCQLMIPSRDALRAPILDSVQVSAGELLAQRRPEQLVGLGSGLTPAGDDFLVGYLAFLHRYGSEKELKALRDALYEARHKTTALSQVFLIRAMEGEFSAPVLALFTAAERSIQEEVLSCTARLCAVGHTSGSDLLGGILYAAKQYGSNAKKEEEIT